VLWTIPVLSSVPPRRAGGMMLELLRVVPLCPKPLVWARLLKMWVVIVVCASPCWKVSRLLAPCIFEAVYFMRSKNDCGEPESTSSTAALRPQENPIRQSIPSSEDISPHPHPHPDCLHRIFFSALFATARALLSVFVLELAMLNICCANAALKDLYVAFAFASEGWRDSGHKALVAQ